MTGMECVCVCVDIHFQMNITHHTIFLSCAVKLGFYIFICLKIFLSLWLLSFFSPKTSISVSAILLGLVLVGRAALVFPLSFLSNLTKKSPYEGIDFKQQV